MRVVLPMHLVIGLGKIQLCTFHILRYLRLVHFQRFGEAFSAKEFTLHNFGHTVAELINLYLQKKYIDI